MSWKNYHNIQNKQSTMRRLLLILLLLNALLINAQPCTSTVYYDNMETWTWTGDWWTPALTTGFFNNASVSSTLSAVIYGSGTSTSVIEQDWYSLPNITGLDITKQYQLKFRLASYVYSSPTATTRGLDVADYVNVQVSTNGGVTYTNELRITGNSNATWPFSSTGIITHTANGTFTNSAPPAGDVYQVPAGATTTAPSTIILNLPANISQIAVDIYCRVNSAGEEFWIDNIELIEIIQRPTLSVSGVTSVCSGVSTTLTATGAQTYSWSGGITNGVAFIPNATTTYNVTGTNTGMINGLGTRNTCTSTSSSTVTVNPIPNVPTLCPDTSICPNDFATLYGSSNIGTLKWYDAPISGTLVGTGPNYTTPWLLANTSYYVESEALGCKSVRSQVNVTVDGCLLPIQLVSFTGENKINYNMLYWVTDIEHNSSHFELQRSSNGIDFKTVGLVQADRNNPYEFLDETPLVGYNYYRLKMVDLDSTYDFSNTIVIEVEKPSTEYSIYPNPVDHTLTYRYYSEIPEKLIIEIHNEIGQLMYIKQDDCESCLNIVHIDLRDLGAGRYTIVIKHQLTGIVRRQSIIKK